MEPVPVPMAPTQRLAVFDVDGMLLQGDSLWLAARHSTRPLDRLWAALRCLPWLIGWQLRWVSTARFKQRTIAAFRICEACDRDLGEDSRQERWLMELRSHLRPEALTRVRWHQDRGDRVLLCSASPRLLLQPLADWLGVELLCTELRRIDGQGLPTLTSPNCKGPEKIRRLTQHLGALEGRWLEAYGDSEGDRELLQAATRPHDRSFEDHPRPYPAFSLGPLLPVVALAAERMTTASPTRDGRGGGRSSRRTLAATQERGETIATAVLRRCRTTPTGQDTTP